MCLRSFLSAIKRLTSSGTRFLVVGISPVNVAGLSIFNIAENLSIDPEFASVAGLTEAEVRLALQQVAGLAKGNKELKNAMRYAKKHYNGYHFFGPTEPLYNPQFIHHYVGKYGKRGVLSAEQVAEDSKLLTDSFNQSLSTAQVKLALKSPAMRDLLLELGSPSKTVQSAYTPNFTDKHVNSGAPSHLFHQGVVTLADAGVKFEEGREVTMHVPHDAVRLSFFEAFEKTLKGTFDSEQSLREPTAEVLHGLLEQMQQSAAAIDVNGKKSSLVGLFRTSLTLQRQAESEFGLDGLKRIDLVARARNGTHILIEFKRVTETEKDRKILKAAMPAYEAATTPDQLRAVGIYYQDNKDDQDVGDRRDGKVVRSTADELLAAAERRLAMYVDLYTARRPEELAFPERTHPKIKAFAVVQLLSKFLVTEVRVPGSGDDDGDDDGDADPSRL